MHENTPSTRPGTQLGLVVLTLCGLLVTTAVEGATIAIQITGLNAQYASDTEGDGGTIFDAGGESRVSVSGDWSHADRISSIDFIRDGKEDVGSLQSYPNEDEFFVDLLIENVPAISENGGEGETTSPGTSVLDLLRRKKGETEAEKLLSLNLGTMTVTYNDSFVWAQAFGNIASITEQNLPPTVGTPGLAPGEDVFFELGGRLTSSSVDGDGNFTAFDLGTAGASIDGTEVPEPGAGLLAAIACGLLGLFFGRRRR